MTTKGSGAIIYYDQDGGPVRRVVTAGDVAAMEAELTALRSAYAVAAAIMRSQPVGIAPRLVQAWREAQQAVEAGQ